MASLRSLAERSRSRVARSPRGPDELRDLRATARGYRRAQDYFGEIAVGADVDIHVVTADSHRTEQTRVRRRQDAEGTLELLLLSGLTGRHRVLVGGHAIQRDCPVIGHRVADFADPASTVERFTVLEIPVADCALEEFSGAEIQGVGN